MIAMCVALVRSLRQDVERAERRRRTEIRERLVAAVVEEVTGGDDEPIRPIESSGPLAKLFTRGPRRT
jgi:hypothetical protein